MNETLVHHLPVLFTPQTKAILIDIDDQAMQLACQNVDFIESYRTAAVSVRPVCFAHRYSVDNDAVPRQPVVKELEKIESI